MPPKPPTPRQVESRPPPQLKPGVAFGLFLLANSIAAFYSPIQDCDEVFNYWEPTHYLNHGHGLQTWEYSPDYAIRSWAYTGLHALVIGAGRLLPFATKTFEFYFLRLTLGLICAACETRLYSTISRTINPRVAIFFLMILVFSPGMYHASVAYLPSSFAMYTTMLGFSAFMDWRDGIRTAQGIFWFALGSLLGWPFAGALILPFILEEVGLALMTKEIWAGFTRLLNGVGMSLVVLALQVLIDCVLYRKFVCVPLNIVLYNVFSAGNKGPNIYGVEPWHFYVRNLALNFTAWFPLALSAFVLLLLQQFSRGNNISKQSALRGFVFIAPFYLWLAIFTLQPHKEERFMYPAYPALALNAAISLHILLAKLGSTDPQNIFSKIPAKLKLTAVCIFILGTLNLGVLRTIGTITAYSAPMQIYASLQYSTPTNAGDFVCLGKEWYRFPSQYFLPTQLKAKFIKSEFTGLLPGEFKEATTELGSFPGTWLVPTGMNDENREDPGKHMNIQHCRFLVDSYFSDTQVSELEPAYVQDKENWEKVSCRPFLDVQQTGMIGRLLWIPDWPFIPPKYRRRWGQYCLLRRRD